MFRSKIAMSKHQKGWKQLHLNKYNRVFLSRVLRKFHYKLHISQVKLYRKPPNRYNTSSTRLLLKDLLRDFLISKPKANLHFLSKEEVLRSLQSKNNLDFRMNTANISQSTLRNKGMNNSQYSSQKNLTFSVKTQHATLHQLTITQERSKKHWHFELSTINFNGIPILQWEHENTSMTLVLVIQCWLDQENLSSTLLFQSMFKPLKSWMELSIKEHPCPHRKFFRPYSQMESLLKIWSQGFLVMWVRGAPVVLQMSWSVRLCLARVWASDRGRWLIQWVL
jgi:hypothetical protein